MRKRCRKLVEHEANGPLVTAPPHLIKRMHRLFDKYTPKDGAIERGTPHGMPDPVLVDRYLDALDAGRIEPPNYHARLVPQRTRIALSVVIDASPSMTTSSVGGRTRLELAAESAAVIASVASMLRYELEVAAFIGTEVVDYHLLPASPRGIELPTSFRVGGTPLGAAVRHSTLRLRALRTRAQHAYSFAISDGHPTCAGPGIEPVADAARAFQEARAKGVRSFSIIIASPEEKEAFEHHFREVIGRGGQYVVIDRVDQMIEPIFKFLRRLVALP